MYDATLRAISCDGCLHPPLKAQPVPTGAHRTRRFAASQGWRYIRVRDKAHDVCPACAPINNNMPDPIDLPIAYVLV